MSEWTSVDDNLPDDGVMVLVYSEHDMFGREAYKQRDVTTGEIRDGKWRCSNYIGNRVLAWMPLPEAPGWC